jgi:hypothetical protein
MLAAMLSSMAFFVFCKIAEPIAVYFFLSADAEILVGEFSFSSSKSILIPASLMGDFFSSSY